MKPLDLIKLLDNKSNRERLEIVRFQLEELGIGYSIQEYSSGTNLFVNLGNANRKIGVGSHYDRVQNSGGANDNSSAIAVCLEIIKKFKELGNDLLGIRVFFFDEEENGLKGSTAYIENHGIKDLIGLINMELVGLGNKFALWPVNEKSDGLVLSIFESASKQRGIVSKRFDQIVTNMADHLPFLRAGLQDSFTITCISDKDVEIAQEYFKALALGADHKTLFDILSTAPVFAHYHMPTDTFEKLSENAIQMTSETICETILSLQKNMYQHLLD